MQTQSYYTVHTQGDAAVAYKLFDPRDVSVRVVVVRAITDALDQGFDDAYEAAHKARQRKRPVDFEMPAPAFGTLESLAMGAPDLGDRLYAMGVSQLIEHLRDAEKVHGRLHESYNGWFEPKPFDKNGLEMTFWRRMHERQVPDMSDVTPPTYDADTKTLTYFTILEDPPARAQAREPYITRHIARKHTVDMAARPWVFAPATPVALLERHPAEIALVDAAFGGRVDVYLPTYLGDVGTMLVNLTPPEASDAGRFVIMEHDEVVGTYSSLEDVVRAYPDLDQAALLQSFLSAIQVVVRLGGRVIHDPETWRGSFGQEQRVRVGAPMFTLDEDLSDYEVIPGRPAPAYADLVAPPKIEGALLTMYVQGAEDRGFKVVLDTSALTEQTLPTSTELAGSGSGIAPGPPGFLEVSVVEVSIEEANGASHGKRDDS